MVFRNENPNVVEVKRQRRKFKDKFLEYSKKARNELLPFCRACFKKDFDNGELKKWREYTNAKLLREEKIVESNKNRSNYGEPIGVMRDYVCEEKWDKSKKKGKKHHMSVEVMLSELGEDYFEKGKKKQSKG